MFAATVKSSAMPISRIVVVRGGVQCELAELYAEDGEYGDGENACDRENHPSGTPENAERSMIILPDGGCAVANDCGGHAESMNNVAMPTKLWSRPTNPYPAGCKETARTLAVTKLRIILTIELPLRMAVARKLDFIDIDGELTVGG